jgi:hypothetical protein
MEMRRSQTIGFSHSPRLIAQGSSHRDRGKTPGATLSIILAFWRPARGSSVNSPKEKWSNKRAGLHRFDARIIATGGSILPNVTRAVAFPKERELYRTAKYNR